MTVEIFKAASELHEEIRNLEEQIQALEACDAMVFFCDNDDPNGESRVCDANYLAPKKYSKSVKVAFGHTFLSAKKTTLDYLLARLEETQLKFQSLKS